jgi:uncharacterized protein (DUF1330 family)
LFSHSNTASKKSALCFGEGKDRHAVSVLGATRHSPVNTKLKERTVVVEYPSLEKATAAYDSAAYGEALKAPGDGAVRDFRIVEGVE